MRIERPIISKLDKLLDTFDPFKTLYYPSGATGLVIAVRGLTIAECKQGYFYVLREVKNSREYTAANGEEKITSSDWFFDTYWRFRTMSEARWFIYHLVSHKKHYEQMYNQVLLAV